MSQSLNLPLQPDLRADALWGADQLLELHQHRNGRESWVGASPVSIIPFKTPLLASSTSTSALSAIAMIGARNVSHRNHTGWIGFNADRDVLHPCAWTTRESHVNDDGIGGALWAEAPDTAPRPLCGSS